MAMHYKVDSADNEYNFNHTRIYLNPPLLKVGTQAILSIH